MGKLIIIKGADFSENALYREKDFNILVAANSIGYVILNATKYGPSDKPSDKNATVVTLDNTTSMTDTWFSFYPNEYVEELQYLNGAFSSWDGYENNKIKEIKIKANDLPTSGGYIFFAPIYTSNIIKKAIIETNNCPYNIGEAHLDYLKMKVSSLSPGLISFGHVDVLDISGTSLYQPQDGYRVGSPTKVIVNNCSEQSITNFIAAQSTAFSETYVQSTDSEGNTVLLLQQ